MNGELVQTVNITLFARHYLRTGEFFPTPLQERRYTSALFRQAGPPPVCRAMAEWLRYFKSEQSLRAVYLSLSTPVENPALAAFANAVPMGLATVRRGGVSLWTAHFAWDEKHGTWHATYNEAPADPGLPEILVPADPEADFLATLRAIAELGYTVDGGEHFAKHHFQKAIDCLEGKIPADRSNFVLHATLPERSRRFLAAVTHAWVFGTMGSWSDLWVRDEELSEQYNLLSSALARDIDRALLFGVNTS